MEVQVSIVVQQLGVECVDHGNGVRYASVLHSFADHDTLV